ncbi:MAG: prephenate dehydrogenase [Gemmataceae bacterium]|nr:prephenate dehydrogenase [Gemmataceae bacterium]MCI0742802.1 prephenate dehydrogenase [Gemmataceae bacterium]
MQIGTLTIVGVGLIGGSIGLAAKQRGLANKVIGIGRNLESLERARKLGAIDLGYLEAAPALRDADFVVFCTPVDQIAQQAVSFAPHCRPGTLLTDAGSTKAKIVAALEGKLPTGVSFVGSHPLAGSEKRGPQFADANLFQNRWTVVTQTPATDTESLKKVSGFWQALGSKVQILSPEEHDRGLAVTSHVPHLVAAALAAGLPAELFDLAATGFRDTTRIAAGDPGLWTAICQHNRDALLEAFVPFQERLAQLRAALESRDWNSLWAFLTQAKKVRDDLGN